MIVNHLYLNKIWIKLGSVVGLKLVMCLVLGGLEGQVHSLTPAGSGGPVSSPGR